MSRAVNGKGERDNMTSFVLRGEDMSESKKGAEENLRITGRKQGETCRSRM